MRNIFPLQFISGDIVTDSLLIIVNWKLQNFNYNLYPMSVIYLIFEITIDLIIITARLGM